MNVIPTELFILIKKFIFHDIKLGKHLRSEKHYKNYNNVVKSVPKPRVPRLGPRIIYSSRKYNIRFCIFIYYVRFKKILFLIKEYNLLNSDYDEKPYLYDKDIRIRYYLEYL